jgi:hypothetical protein
MIPEFERYHGVVLRDLVVCCGSIAIKAVDLHGRVNTFMLDDEVGLVIKHSTARLPPWLFTYDDRQLEEIEDTRWSAKAFWFAHVCGQDGVLSISYDEFRAINPVTFETTAFVRVDKGRHTRYRVFGTAGELGAKKSRGVGAIVETLRSLR